MVSRPHFERHRSTRVGWLRASVLGANDGIVSTASLIVGVAAAPVSQDSILLSGIAGLVAGAMSMAAGEFVSVSSQADTERADLERERHELQTDPEFELKELTQIYVDRGVDPDLASRVAHQLMEHDALATHAREELGISEAMSARPVQAALASAATFAIGALLPLLIVFISPREKLILWVSVTSLTCLLLLGFLSARAGGSNGVRAAVRVVFWGAFAMALTAIIGAVFGATIA